MKDKLVAGAIALGLIVLGYWMGTQEMGSSIYKSCIDYGSASLGEGSIACYPTIKD